MLQAAHPADTFGRGYLESRKAVDDGYIWPYDHPQMVAAGAITERMVEDVATLVNDGGDAPCVTLDDLTRLGWLPAQVQRCGAKAFAQYEAAHPQPREVTGNRSTVRRSGWRQEAAALALFALPVALLARQMLGV